MFESRTKIMYVPGHSDPGLPCTMRTEDRHRHIIVHLKHTVSVNYCLVAHLMTARDPWSFPSPLQINQICTMVRLLAVIVLDLMRKNIEFLPRR